jgi:polysaccharide biosynthesis protein PslH
MSSKVCIVSTYLPFPKYNDGTTIRLFNIISELIAMGAEVVFILIDKYGVSNNIENDKLGIDFRVIPMTRYEKIISHCRIDALCLESIRTNFNQIFDYDAHDYVIVEGMFSASLIDPTYKKSVVNVVDAMSLVALREIRSKSFWTFKAYVRFIQCFFFEKLILSKFHNITVVAADDAKYLSKITLGKIHVINNGVDVKEFKVTNQNVKSEFSKKICFVANFAGFMNEEALHYLVHHVAPVVYKLLGVHTSIIGKNIPEFAKNVGEDYLEIYEDVESTAEYIKSADIFICPVVYGSGIKNSVLQAVALNIPVVCRKEYMKTHHLTQHQNGYGFKERAEIVDIIQTFYESKSIPKIDNTEIVNDHLLWSSCVKKTLVIIDDESR